MAAMASDITTPRLTDRRMTWASSLKFLGIDGSGRPSEVSTYAHLA